MPCRGRSGSACDFVGSLRARPRKPGLLWGKKNPPPFRAAGMSEDSSDWSAADFAAAYPMGGGTIVSRLTCCKRIGMMPAIRFSYGG
ncbi:hypothetical protein MESS4_310039 [Mesorhizobium sp. STM 4661]|nr:hypothetical protein MESS4_310039 [Mesorhizobium sp. STM 4661]